MKVSGREYSEKLIVYVKMILLAVLVMAELTVCFQTAARYSDTEGVTDIIIVASCCVALTFIVSVDTFAVRSLRWRIVFFSVENILLLAISIFTGSSVLSALYCVILTQLYMNLNRFSDKAVFFGVSCAMYTISFIIGWLLANAGKTLFNSAVDIITGVLFGLLIIAADFAIVQFLLSFYRTNKMLSQALKDADESRSRLEDAYEKLSHTAVYEERNRIAKDIHDNVGHSITTVIMQTEAAKLMIDSDPQGAKNRIISANLQARNALEQMRDSVHLLAGREGAQSVKEAMAAIIVQTIDGTDIKVRYDIADLNLEDNVIRYLTNTLKECLSNGIRHGGATAFYVELSRDDDYIRLYVSDNGRGAEGKIVKNFGLRGVTEKAESFGGTCEIASEKGEGFEVTVKLPYSIRAAQNNQSGEKEKK